MANGRCSKDGVFLEKTILIESDRFNVTGLDQMILVTAGSVTVSQGAFQLVQLEYSLHKAVILLVHNSMTEILIFSLSDSFRTM